jgi:hypothetical protein
MSCSVQFDSVKKASLDSVSCGLVSCGRSDAHGSSNNQQIRTKTVPKKFTGSFNTKAAPNNNKTSNTFIVDKQIYNVNYKNKSHFDEFECVMHSIKL